MFCQVTFHRHQGLQLPVGQLPPSITGQLSLASSAPRNLHLRSDSSLVLLEPAGSTFRTAAVLLDPVLIHLKDGVLVFRGIERRAVTQRSNPPTSTEPLPIDVWEHIQVWHCRPVSQPAPGSTPAG